MGRVSVESCHAALRGGGPERIAVEALLGRRHWLHGLADFDLRTGQMLLGSLESICARIRAAPPRGVGEGFKDRLYRIVEHADRPLREILRHLNERMVREHATLPIRAVRELDSTSILALGRRPGRTVREKVADRPYLLAVERRWTSDTSENRLVKALCLRLAQLLDERRQSQESGTESVVDDFSALVERWLQSPAAQEIGRWEHVPPNNILLQHRDYRPLWDAWSWCESLDEDLQRDQDEGLLQWTTLVFWSIVSRLAGAGGVRVLEQPCHPDYEAFSILPARGASQGRVTVEGVMTAARGTHSAAAAGERPGQREVSAPAPEPFRIVLTPGVDIHLEAARGARLQLRFSPSGPYARVQAGAKVAIAEMTAEEAVTIAANAVSGAFGAGALRPGPAAIAAPSAPLPAPFYAVDLCHPQPRFADEARSGTLPFRLLWQLWDSPGQEAAELDLGTACAVALGSELTTVSILDLLAAETELPADVLSRAGRFFATKLAQALPAQALAYVVPDATDDFALGFLRRSINAEFRAAEPIPRSVAAVFAWQSSTGFPATGLDEDDCVLVLDTVGSRLSATPLLAHRNGELARRLPESAGLSWKRLPTVLCEASVTSTALATATLEQLACPFPAEPARLLGFQGLTSEGSGLSWQGEDGAWFTLPDPRKTAEQSVFGAGPDIWSQLVSGLTPEFRRLAAGKRVFVLRAVGALQGARLGVPGVHEGHAVRLVGDYEAHLGAAVLHRWQARAGDIPLWRDHLPDLSMRVVQDGRHSRFELVKDVSVAPRRGQAVRIEIRDRFLLPAGLPDYRFPLLQGTGGSALRYEAFLRSPAFPLAQDLEVEVRLTYTYGSDTPYELVFKPLVEVPGLNGVRAEWRLRTEVEDLPAHFPTLPSAVPWSTMERYPKRDSSETSDLLAWIRKELERHRQSGAALASPRTGVVVDGPRTFPKGGRYFLAQLDSGRIRCQEADFLVRGTFDAVKLGDSLTFVVEADNASRARAIAAGTDTERGKEVLEDRRRKLAQDLKRGLRFPFITIWSGGRTLSSPEAPGAFREFMCEGMATLLSLRAFQERGRTAGTVALADEALFLLCCMHADAPTEVVTFLKAVFPPERCSVLQLKRYHRHIALALGACQTDWQRELLEAVSSAIARDASPVEVHGLCLGILGVALWRCGEALDELSNEALVAIIERLTQVLGQAHANIENRRPGWSPLMLKDHLELVLALLRTRGAEDPVRKGLLAPGRPTTRALARTIEDIVDSVSKHDIALESRLSLDVEKPPALSRTPTLLYALKLYLTGDDSARAIRVMEVRDDGRDGV
ncbi:DUF2357 domain-containing protein [Corallococcus sp. RDP092CA]|uniref:DUF2357 domain-containing protein n=1 Tax=Corallococcus sp. RDP092CA TaxID=3109369 RepID=UPI0035AE99CE